MEKWKNPLESFQPGHFLERDDVAAEIKFGRGLSFFFFLLHHTWSVTWIHLHGLVARAHALLLARRRWWRTEMTREWVMRFKSCNRPQQKSYKHGPQAETTSSQNWDVGLGLLLHITEQLCYYWEAEQQLWSSEIQNTADKVKDHMINAAWWGLQLLFWGKPSKKKWFLHFPRHPLLTKEKAVKVAVTTIQWRQFSDLFLSFVQAFAIICTVVCEIFFGLHPRVRN